jgi:hypothetical protein
MPGVLSNFDERFRGKIAREMITPVRVLSAPTVKAGPFVGDFGFGVESLTKCGL